MGVTGDENIIHIHHDHNDKEYVQSHKYCHFFEVHKPFHYNRYILCIPLSPYNISSSPNCHQNNFTYFSQRNRILHTHLTKHIILTEKNMKINPNCSCYNSGSAGCTRTHRATGLSSTPYYIGLPAFDFIWQNFWF